MNGAVSAMPAPARIETLARRWVPLAMLGALFTVLLLQLANTTRSALVLIGYPFGIDYGEGIVWQQMRNIVAGRGYAPLGTYPAIVYHYPPVYHLVTAGLARVAALDELAAGRWVSWTATLGMGAVLAVLAWAGRAAEERLARALAAALVSLIFLGTDPVIQWSAAMRVDMLAGLFGLSGMACAVYAARHRLLIYPAALLVVAAMFTKQVSVAAPLAAWAGLLATAPRRAWLLALIAGMLGLAGLGVASWITYGGFLTHILFYNINRFSPDFLPILLNLIQVHGVYLALAGAGAWLLVRRLRLGRPDADPVERASAVAILVFLVAKTAMLAMLMKSGANSNYLVEWCAAVALAAAFALGPVVAGTIDLARQRDHQTSALFVACLLGLVAMQAVNLSRRAISQNEATRSAHSMWRLVDAIRQTPDPVISDEMTLLIRAGRPVEWEPAIAAELGAQGLYDQAGFVRLVRRRAFGMFVTQGSPGVPIFDARYNLPVLAAILANYPVTQDFDGTILRRPRPAR